MASPVLCRATGIGTPGAGVTCYPPLAAGARLRYGNTLEVQGQLKYHTSGTFSALVAVVQTNTCTTASTVNFRKNGANGNSTVSIGSSATGTFEDLVHTDTIAVSDLVNLQIINAAVGSLTIYQVGMLFTAASANTVSKVGTGVSSGETGTSVTLFTSLCGNNDSTATGTGLGATEAATQLRIAEYCTAAFFSVHCDTNSRTTTSTYRTRQNNVSGQTISIGAGATGLFEDVSTTETLVPGDLYNLALVYGTGVGALGISNQSVEFSTPGTSHPWTNNWLLFAALAASSTTYINPHGLFQLNSAVESDVQLKPRVPLVISAAAAYVSANATAASSTITFRNNSNDSALAMTVGAGATGLFTNLTNSELIGATSLVDWKVIVGSGGTFKLTTLSAKAQALVPNLEPTNTRFGPNPTKHPLKGRRFRPTPPGDLPAQSTAFIVGTSALIITTTSVLGSSSTTGAFEIIGSSRFGWSPSRRPMLRRSLRPSSADGTSTAYLFGSATLIITTLPLPVLTATVPTPDYDGTSRSLFGWTPARRPMQRQSLRPSSADGTSTVYLVGTSTLILTTIPVLTAKSALTGSSTLIITTTAALTVTKALTGASTLVITTTAVLTAKANVIGSSTLVLVTSPVLTAKAAILGTSVLVLVNIGTINTGAVINTYLLYYDSRITRTHIAIAKKKSIRRRRRR